MPVSRPSRASPIAGADTSVVAATPSRLTAIGGGARFTTSCVGSTGGSASSARTVVGEAEPLGTRIGRFVGGAEETEAVEGTSDGGASEGGADVATPPGGWRTADGDCTGTGDRGTGIGTLPPNGVGRDGECDDCGSDGAIRMKCRDGPISLFLRNSVRRRDISRLLPAVEAVAQRNARRGLSSESTSGPMKCQARSALPVGLCGTPVLRSAPKKGANWPSTTGHDLLE
jgi:hypothetical protein